jgi:hypothetical protein
MGYLLKTAFRGWKSLWNGDTIALSTLRLLPGRKQRAIVNQSGEEVKFFFM